MRGATPSADAGRRSRGSSSWWCALCALVVALAIQIGTNYANDYSDGIRGTDDARVGPVRLVGLGPGLTRVGPQGGAARLRRGRRGRAGPGLGHLVVAVLLVGAACLAAGWFYTGGPRPYGYVGLGELFVFVFFGLVATVGTFYVQTLRARGAGRLVCGGGGRPAGHRAVAGQQPPRHRLRRREREAHPRGATRAASCWFRLPPLHRRTLRGRAGLVARRVGLAGCAGPPTGPAAHPVGAARGGRARPSCRQRCRRAGRCFRCWPLPVGCRWSSECCWPPRCSGGSPDWLRWLSPCASGAPAADVVPAERADQGGHVGRPLEVGCVPGRRDHRGGGVGPDGLAPSGARAR